MYQTSRACLVQVIICVFQRMEADSQVVSGNPKVVLDALTKNGDVEPTSSNYEQVSKFLIDGLGLNIGGSNQQGQELLRHNEWEGIYNQIPDSPMNQEGIVFYPFVQII